MKTHRYILLMIIATLALSGCDKFLERKAQNLVVPTTCQQFKEMLQGDGYFYNLVGEDWWLSLMSDDLTYRTLASSSDAVVEDNSIITYRLVYQWAAEIESEANSFYDGLYAYCYNQILVANIVMDNIDNVKGTDDEIETLRGQALFHRAFAYFYLATLYADVYSAENLDLPCVPLKLTSTPSTTTYPRATIGQVWKQISDDIGESVDCLAKKEFTNIYEVNGNAALLIAMRVALFMNDVEAVIDYGTQLMAKNDKLFDITAKNACVTELNATGGNDVANFISSGNPELLWLYGHKTQTVAIRIAALLSNTFFSVSDELTAEYDYNAKTKTGDHRLPYFFVAPGISSLQQIPCRYYYYNTYKYDYNDGLTRANALRTGEAYLMMAEAYARRTTPDTVKALTYLNALRSKRIDNYTALTAAELPNAEQIVEFIYHERRRELCFEELHRWWDLRRMGKPEMEHLWAGGEKYRMNCGDAGYILDFPITERNYDPSNANPRPIRTPIE